MAKKTAPIPSKPRQADADEWVSGQTPATKEVPPAKTGGTKRLTLDLDEDLHRRIKVACSIRGSTMVEEITKLLDKAFPAS
jgi:ParG protein